MTDVDVQVRLKADGSGIEAAFDGAARSGGRLGNELDNTARKGAGASRSLQDVSRQAGQLATQAGRAGRRLSLLLTTPILAAAGAAAKLAIDAEETANKFDVVFGPAADRARAQLEGLTRTIPLTTAQMQGLASGVQDMLIPMGLARDEAADLSVDMIRLAGDLASFNNVRPDEVLDAVQSALAGMSQPLRRYGVDVSQARLENLALERGLIRQGEALSNAARAQAIMIAVTQDSSDAIGDAARTVDSAANQLRFLRRDVTQLGEEIGQMLIPIVQTLVVNARDVVGWFAGLDSQTQRNIVGMAALAAAIGPALIALSMTTKAVITLTAAATALQARLTAMLAVKAGIVAAVVAIAVALERQLTPGMEQVSLGAQSFNIVSRAVVILREALLGMGELMLALGVTITGAFQAMVAPLTGIVSSLTAGIKAASERDVAGVKAAFASVPGEIQSAYSDALQQMNSGVGFAVESLTTRTRTAVDEVNRLQRELLETGNESQAAAGKVSNLGRVINGAIRTALSYGQAMQQVSTHTVDATSDLSALESQADQLQDRLEGQADSLREQIVGFNGGAQAIRRWRIEQLAAAGATGEMLDRLREQSAELDQLETDLARLRTDQTFQDLARDLALQAAQANMSEEAIHALNRELFIQEQIARLGADATREQAEALRELAGAAFDATNELAEGPASLGQRIADGVQNGLETGLDRFMGSLSDRDMDDLLSGNFGAVGRRFGQQMTASVFEGVGDAIGGPIGGAIGNVIGQIIGRSIFGEKAPKFQVGGTTGFASTGGTARGSVDTALGETLFRFRGIEDEAQRELLRALTDFDANLAQAIGTANLGAAQDAIRNLGFDSADDGESFEALAEARVEAVIDAVFDASTAALVRRANGLEATVQRIADVLDIQRQVGLGRGIGLGAGDTLAAVEDLARPAETLGQAFERLRETMASLDTAAALTGRQLADTRSGVLAFGDALVEQFGDNAGELGARLGRVIGLVFSDEQVAQAASDEARQRAGQLLGQLGLDVTSDMLSQSGFADVFNDLFGTLGPAETAILIEAGNAIADLVDAEEDLLAARDSQASATRELADLMRGVSRDIQDMQWSPLRRSLHDARDELDNTIAAIERLNGSEADLAMARERYRLRIQALDATLRSSLMDLIDDFVEGSQGAGRQIADQMRNTGQQMAQDLQRAFASVSEWLDRQLLSNLSTLTPTERLNEARGQFDAVFAAVQAGDFSRVGDLSGLADQVLREQGSFSGTASPEFLAVESQIRAAMQAVADMAPAGSAQPPTFAQTESIVSATRNTERSAADQLRTAARIVDELGVLSGISGRTPFELAQELNAPLGDIVRALTGELPNLTGDALADYFNELVAEQDHQLEALGTIESLISEQMAIDIEIRDLLDRIASNGAAMNAANGLPSYRVGSAGLGRDHIAQVHRGEKIIDPTSAAILDRYGIQVRGGGDSEEIRALRAEIRQMREEMAALLGEANGNLRTGFVAVVNAERETTRKLDQATQPGTRRGKVMQ